MRPERWEQIDHLLQSALARMPQERSVFLAQACGDDELLRSEVESLIASHEDANNFLNTPRSQLAADFLVSGQARMTTGQKIGHYKVIRSLGSGGMGEVYLAQDSRLGRKVALKLLPDFFTHERARLRRFEQEARLASALSHPNVCTVHEVGETEGGGHYIVMEYVEGETLRHRMNGGRMQLAEVLDIGTQIASALVAAHAQGIIHRDIKPENVMLRRDHLVKVLDFGVAKLAEPKTSGPEDSTQALVKTGAGMVIGTVNYMSPEQARGEEVDSRTDIWSLGVMLYEMVTRRAPFEAATSSHVIVSILEKEPMSLSALNPEIPDALDWIVTKSLAKDREQRYQTVKDMLLDLKKLRERLSFQAELERSSAPGKKSKSSAAAKRTTSSDLEETKEGTEALGWRSLRSAIKHPAFTAIIALPILLSLLVAVSVLVWQRLIRPVPARELAQRQLTANIAENHLLTAAISPDGKYLAYSDQKGTHLQLIQTGQMQTVAAPEQFVASNLNWLADGTGILASGEQGGRSSSIWLISILGGSPRKLRDDAAAPVASPDGSLIAFLGDLAQGIWLMDNNGENARRVLSAPPGQLFFRVRWAPDGQRLAYTQSVPGLPALGTEVLESVSLNGGIPTAIVTQAGLQDFYWLPDGRILYSVAQEAFAGTDSNLWEIQTEGHTGKAGHPKQLTNWADFSFTDFSSTRDGKRLAFLKLSSEMDVYVGALEKNGTRLKTPWRLTMDERNDWPIEWTADGRSVVFWSNRNGTWDIFKQRIDQETAEMIPAGTGPKWYGHFSPDGAWFLYMALPKQQIPGLSLPVKIMRVPASGGPPQVVLNATGTTGFRCARALPNLCVFNEVVGNQTVFTSFDPVKGKGDELASVNSLQNHGSDAFDLSPDGSRLAIALSDSQQGRVRLVSLTDGTAFDLVVKGWNRLAEVDWAPDGRGLYVSYVWGGKGNGVLYVDLQGHAHVLWQQQPGLDTCGRPSPDGRSLAIASWTTNANAWMIENY
jgi:eukaryotic-like serine/threonine-protein kinase